MKKLLLLLCFLIPTSNLFAQVKLPEGVPSLDDESRFLISSQNVSAYKDILTDEMYSWIEKRRFLLFASAGLEIDFTKVGAENLTASELLEEVLASHKVSSSIDYDYAYHLLNRKGLISSFETALLRSYDTPSEEEPKLFKEVFYINGPERLKDYFLRTFRSADQVSDSVLLYSPLLKKKRALFEPNRADPIVSGVLAANDFFVFSENVSKLSVRIDKRSILLLPFYSLSVSEVRKGRGGAQEVVSGFSKSMLLWNFETTQFEQAAPWLPTTVHFVPRNTITLELISSDVLSSYSKIVLVVDEESRLPIYKFVYDQKGDLDRTVIGIWGQGVSETDSFPFLAGLIAVSGKTSEASVLSANKVRMLSKIPLEVEKIFLEE